LLDDQGRVRAICPGHYRRKFDCHEDIKHVQASARASIEGLKEA
jgi:hypothetical protein